MSTRQPSHESLPRIETVLYQAATGLSGRGLQGARAKLPEKLRRFARQPQVHRIGTDVDVRSPLDRSVGREPYRVEERRVVPRLEHTTSGQVGEVDFSFSTVIVSEPDSEIRECFNLDRLSHDHAALMASGYRRLPPRPFRQEIPNCPGFRRHNVGAEPRAAATRCQGQSARRLQRVVRQSFSKASAEC